MRQYLISDLFLVCFRKYAAGANICLRRVRREVKVGFDKAKAARNSSAAANVTVQIQGLARAGAGDAPDTTVFVST
jgi:hypothetical protein